MSSHNCFHDSLLLGKVTGIPWMVSVYYRQPDDDECAPAFSVLIYVDSDAFYLSRNNAGKLFPWCGSDEDP